MTIPGCSGRIASDPIGLITDLVAAVEHQLTLEQIRAVATAVAGGRAKSRRLASALADRPGVLAKIAAIFAASKIGISSVIQPEGHEGESVPLILMIHDAPNAAMRKALARIA